MSSIKRSRKLEDLHLSYLFTHPPFPTGSHFSVDPGVTRSLFVYSLLNLYRTFWKEGSDSSWNIYETPLRVVSFAMIFRLLRVSESIIFISLPHDIWSVIRISSPISSFISDLSTLFVCVWLLLSSTHSRYQRYLLCDLRVSYKVRWILPVLSEGSLSSSFDLKLSTHSERVLVFLTPLSGVYVSVFNVLNKLLNVHRVLLSWPILLSHHSFLFIPILYSFSV